jgi:DNA invertase Pin-like site-specific DNA recombinase
MEITLDKTPKVAVAYCRVSTSEQAESGLGLKAQRDAIKKFAKSQGIHIRKYYTDAGISGTKGVDARPALAEMLSDLKPNTAVLVHKLCRLSRDSFLNLWIEKECGKISCQILSASGEGNGSSATDKLLRGIISNFAEFERNLISTRTKNALAKLKQTRKLGRPPYGFTFDSVGRMIKKKGEFQNLERMIELRSELGNKWTQMSKVLNGEERTSQSGGRWYASTVQNCILRYEESLK